MGVPCALQGEMDRGDVAGGKEVTGGALTALTSDPGEGGFGAAWETGGRTKSLVKLRRMAGESLG